jgi:hypothetical protein
LERHQYATFAPAEQYSKFPTRDRLIPRRPTHLAASEYFFQQVGGLRCRIFAYLAFFLAQFVEKSVKRLADYVVADVQVLIFRKRNALYCETRALYCWVTPFLAIVFSTTGRNAAVSWGVVFSLK